MKKFIVCISACTMFLAIMSGCGDSTTKTGQCDSSAEGDWVKEMDSGCKYQTDSPFTWSGKCVDGYVHGEGTIQWYDEDGEKRRERYTGNVTCGKNEGYGEYYYADGSSYKGEWRNDHMHGNGVIINADGERFAGEFAYGQPVVSLASATSQDDYSESSAACPIDVSDALERLQTSSSFGMIEAIEYTKAFVIPKLGDSRCDQEKRQVCSRLNTLWDYSIRLNAAERDGYSGFTVVACKSVCSMKTENERPSCEAECDGKERERIRSQTSQYDENRAKKEQFMYQQCS